MKTTMRHISRVRVAPMLALILVGAVISGCTGQHMYKVDQGPHTVEVREVALTDPIQGRDVRMRVAAPREPGSYPVVIFSAGMFCQPQSYASVTDHWASHGYVVITPFHIDAGKDNKDITADQRAKLLDFRIRDLSFAADSASSVVPAGRADSSRMAVGGHSFGGMLAVIMVGAKLKDPKSDNPVSRADPRFRAAIVMSGVGELPPIAKGAFADLTGPLIANGGTLDAGIVGTTVLWPWEWRMSPYTLAPPGDKYSIVLDQGNHYLGGLIGNPEKGGEDDNEGLAVVRSLQTAFLDTYLKDDAGARRFLTTADIRAIAGPRVTFERK